MEQTELELVDDLVHELMLQPHGLISDQLIPQLTAQLGLPLDRQDDEAELLLLTLNRAAAGSRLPTALLQHASELP